MGILRVDRLSGGYGRNTILFDIGLHVDSKEIVCLIGPNGAGKSTLLNMVTGLLSPATGTVEFRGASITGCTTDTIVRSGLVLVPERRQLFGDMSVEENLLLGSYSMARANKAAEVSILLSEQFDRFTRLAERWRQLAGSLSGGEQQMLAIARALMCRPRLVLLDEPSLGLAPLFVEAVFQLIQQLRDGGLSVLLVEQNAHMALSIADRAYVLEAGRIVLSGDARWLENDPRVKSAYLDGGIDGEREMERRIRSNVDRLLAASKVTHH